MMHYLGPLIVTSADLHKQFNTKSWKSHTEAWDKIFATGNVIHIMHHNIHMCLLIIFLISKFDA